MKTCAECGARLTWKDRLLLVLRGVWHAMPALAILSMIAADVIRDREVKQLREHVRILQEQTAIDTKLLSDLVAEQRKKAE